MDFIKNQIEMICSGISYKLVYRHNPEESTQPAKTETAPSFTPSQIPFKIQTSEKRGQIQSQLLLKHQFSMETDGPVNKLNLASYKIPGLSTVE